MGHIKLFFRLYFFVELGLNSKLFFFLGCWTTSKTIHAEKPTELRIKYQDMYWTKVFFLLIKKEKSKKEMWLLAACFSCILKREDLIFISFEFDCQEKDIIVSRCLFEVSFVFLLFLI